MKKEGFDFDAFKREAAGRLKKGESLLGKDGVFTPLLKEFLEEALSGELDAHLEGAEEANRRNGKVGKRLKTSLGNVELDTPRDRNGTFEPEIVPKRQRTLGVDLDRQILALYARGASLGDISDHLSGYFKYTKEIRRIIYTTNTIEGFHRQLRSVTKSKGAFTSEDALLKLLFLAQENITAKWKRPVHNWNQTLSQLSIIFGERLRLGL